MIKMLDFRKVFNYNLKVVFGLEPISSYQGVRFMNLAKKITAVFIVIAMIFCFAACANDDAEAQLDIGTINIGYITTGDVDNDAYAAFHYNQFKNAYGLAGAGNGQVTVEKKVPAGDADAMAKAIDDLSSRGCRLIVGMDAGYKADFEKFAKENPTIFFALAGTSADESSVEGNLAILNVKAYQGEYLAGIAAGTASEKGKVAYIADTTYAPVNNENVNAFAEGAKSAGAKVVLISTENVKEAVDKAKDCDVVYSTNYTDEETGETLFNIPESFASTMSVNKLTKDGTEFVTGPALNLDFLYTKIVLNTVNETFGDLAKFNWDVKDGVVDIFPAKDEKVKSAVDKARDQFMAGKDSLKITDELKNDIEVL